MKLLSFAKDGGAHVGAVVPEGIVNLTAALQATNPVRNPVVRRHSGARASPESTYDHRASIWIPGPAFRE